MKYRKIPVVIDAFQLGVDFMPDWFMDAISANDVILNGDYDSKDVNANIKTLEGILHAENKDFIIRGIKGEIYPCKPGIFEKTYEQIGED